MKNTEHIWTVYQHIFPNEIYYIGITSQDPIIRWNNGKGYKGQKLYELIQQYDWNTEIKHEILYTHLTQEEASTIEKYLISAWKIIDPKKICYNIAAGGMAPLILKRVYQYDINGLYLNSYNSVTEAAEATGDSMSAANIRNCCYGNRKTANGYRWSYEKLDTLPELIISKKIKEKPLKVDQYSLDNILINSYHTNIEAEQKTGVPRGSISKCLCKKQKSAGGYKWVKHGENLDDEITLEHGAQVNQYDLNGNYITTFSSVSAANKAMIGTVHGHIGEACRGIHKTAYGYIWRYQILDNQ